MRFGSLICVALAISGGTAQGCQDFPASKSSAFDATLGKINIPWRTDFPTALPSTGHGWEQINFETSWRKYAAAVLQEIRDSGITISGGTIALPATANWWIAPWMDYGASGREKRIGLTKERSPDPKDLSPTSPGDLQTWAIGWYNQEGAFGLGQIYANPCDPSVPSLPNGSRWTFPAKSASFKFLFTEATDAHVKYLKGAPVVQAFTRSKTSLTKLRLIQVDIAVRDPRATLTGWVFGTFVWKGPKKGDGLFDNLVPVGLAWGNDPTKQNNELAKSAQLFETRLNNQLAGKVWQKQPQSWPARPYPGFQGRLNGPADNWRSSCISCHSSAQYPRHPVLGSPPRINQSDTPTPTELEKIVAAYFANVQGGHLIDPVQDSAQPLPAVSLDYSLQLQTAFTRICQACSAGALTGATPRICLKSNGGQIESPTCPAATSPAAIGADLIQKVDVNNLMQRQ
ncbi:hypothetical protein SAMN05518865_11993 [Duganella sp. CF458]|nr:hypothetical protein SAMN05518865_11993 [Duganella sp. CF458]